MPDLLIEFRSEEIPARMQRRAADDLSQRLKSGLDALGLPVDTIEASAAPRRLYAAVSGLPERQADVREERRGPRVGAPDKAISGFLSSVGLDSLDQCEQRETPKGAFWFAVIERSGQPTTALLPDLITDIARAFPWPKSMRWGSGTLRWVRPLHGIAAVFDGRPLDGGLDVGGDEGVLAFSAATRGHRFLAPGEIRVEALDDYRERLREARVVADWAERRQRIADELAGAAAKLGLVLPDDPGLLDEVTGLVEWPVVFAGTIDDRFMSLPPEVLSTSMRVNQRYFSLNTPGGGFADRFLLVSDTEPEDGGAATVAGNERVLRARLADAAFFWDTDRRLSLADRVDRLASVTFHARLGTMAAKARRMADLAAEVASFVPGCRAQSARAAARLAKADLVTEMVGEFPELQGIMGGYYARADGHDDAVADAIASHYRPAGPNDRGPDRPVAITVALADKLDTLAGFFAIGETPTGSKDPYALRRAALGVIRIIVENGIRIPLVPVITAALDAVEADRAGIEGETPDSAAVSVPGFARPMPQAAADLLTFMADRLKVVLRDQGVRHDLIDAVFTLGGEDDLVRLLARVRALNDFLDSHDGASLLIAYRRAANIVRIEERKDGVTYAGAPDAGLLSDDAEKRLAQALDQASAQSARQLEGEDFVGAMAALASLRKPIDAFFEGVTVNAEQPELRRNRLLLLSRLGGALNQVADFSRIEGGGQPQD